jgi:hypothetical protein
MAQGWKPDRSEVSKQGLGRTRALRGEKAVNKAKIDHGTMNFFKEGGDIMAKNPFAGKETKKEERAEKAKFGSGAAYKKAEAKFEGEKMACGGKVKKYARGGGVESKGKTRGKFV